MNNLSPEQREHVEMRLKTEPTIWLSRVRPDCRPHTVPVWFYWDGSDVYFGSQGSARKMRNLAENPHVTLALPDTQNVIVIEGQAAFVPPEEVGPIMTGYGQKYARAMKAMGMDVGGREGFRLARVTPQKTLAWGMPEGSDDVDAAQGDTQS